MPSAAFAGVLSSLDGPTIDRLRLRAVPYEAGEIISAPGDRLREVLFLQSGLASVMVPGRGLQSVGAAFLGPETIANVCACLGSGLCEHTLLMQVSGGGFACDAERALKEFGRGEQFQQVALQAIRSQMAELTQRVGCFAAHSVMQRLCGWLLELVSRTGQAVIPLSDTAMSQVVGVSRRTLRLAYEELARLGTLQLGRDSVRVHNTAALRVTACDCLIPTLFQSHGKASAQCVVPVVAEGDARVCFPHGTTGARDSGSGLSLRRKSYRYLQ